MSKTRMTQNSTNQNGSRLDLRTSELKASPVRQRAEFNLLSSARGSAIHSTKHLLGAASNKGGLASSDLLIVDETTRNLRTEEGREIIDAEFLKDRLPDIQTGAARFAEGEGRFMESEHSMVLKKLSTMKVAHRSKVMKQYQRLGGRYQKEMAQQFSAKS